MTRLMEKLLMPQINQIRERFLDDARRHFFSSDSHGEKCCIGINACMPCSSRIEAVAGAGKTEV